MRIANTSFILIIIILFYLAFPTQSSAQGWWYGAATYQVSLPLGDTKDFTNKVSWRGVGLDFRKEMNSNTTLGLYFGWNVFHERTADTIDNLEFDGNPGAITGLQDRTINSFPIMLTGHKYFGQQGSTRLFLGLNAGGFIMKQRFEIGIRAYDKSQWQWGGAPEIGAVVPVGYSTLLVINAKFYYALTGDSVAGGSANQSYLTFGVGLAWEQ